MRMLGLILKNKKSSKMRGSVQFARVIAMCGRPQPRRFTPLCRHCATHRNPLLYVLAGEPSGDIIGGHLLGALQEKVRHAAQPGGSSSPFRFRGVGGVRMQREGLVSIFPMKDLTHMGFVELLTHLPRLSFRLFQTVLDIQRQNPDAIVTIDSKGFNFRVLKYLKVFRACEQLLQPQSKQNCPVFHYVAPSTWATKSGICKYKRDKHAVGECETI